MAVANIQQNDEKGRLELPDSDDIGVFVDDIVTGVSNRLGWISCLLVRGWFWRRPKTPRLRQNSRGEGLFVTKRTDLRVPANNVYNADRADRISRLHDRGFGGWRRRSQTGCRGTVEMCKKTSSIIGDAIRSELVSISKQSHRRWQNQVQLPYVNSLERFVLDPPGLDFALREVEVQ